MSSDILTRASRLITMLRENFPDRRVFLEDLRLPRAKREGLPVANAIRVTLRETSADRIYWELELTAPQAARPTGSLDNAELAAALTQLFLQPPPNRQWAVKASRRIAAGETWELLIEERLEASAPPVLARQVTPVSAVYMDTIAADVNSFMIPEEIASGILESDRFLLQDSEGLVYLGFATISNDSLETELSTPRVINSGSRLYALRPAWEAPTIGQFLAAQSFDQQRLFAVNLANAIVTEAINEAWFDIRIETDSLPPESFRAFEALLSDGAIDPLICISPERGLYEVILHRITRLRDSNGPRLVIELKGRALQSIADFLGESP